MLGRLCQSTGDRHQQAGSYSRERERESLSKWFPSKAVLVFGIGGNLEMLDGTVKHSQLHLNTLRARLESFSKVQAGLAADAGEAIQSFGGIMAIFPCPHCRQTLLHSRTSCGILHP